MKRLLLLTAIAFATSLTIPLMAEAGVKELAFTSASISAHAEDTPTVSAPEQSPKSEQSTVTSPELGFFQQVVEYFTKAGGWSWALRISALFTLIISSMKVSFLNELIWSKFGEAKVWAAPLLGLIAGVLNVPFPSEWSMAGISTFLAGVTAYIFSGYGSVAMHEFLDSLKAMPWAGPSIDALIDWIKGKLGGPQSTEKKLFS